MMKPGMIAVILVALALAWNFGYLDSIISFRTTKDEVTEALNSFTTLDTAELFSNCSSKEEFSEQAPTPNIGMVTVIPETAVEGTDSMAHKGDGSLDLLRESQDGSMFMFAKNSCKPECCSSSYSCDGGCVCQTEEQKGLLATRGGNN